MVSRRVLCGILALASVSAFGQENFIRDNFDKREVRVPMRDGKTLFTSIYIPKKLTSPAPFLMMRTPYSCRPYGADAYRGQLGPEASFNQLPYIFVYQDVRGRYQSEGDFNWMNPYIPNKQAGQVDESTDTRDTIDWLLKNVPNNNGRVGVYGTSFPGHYAAQTLIDPHPALRAVSPQAPMDDNWMGDDMFHNGAFFLPHAMNFISGFGVPRTGPTSQYGPRAFTHDNPDGYEFFLKLGPIASSNEKYNMKTIDLWQKWINHPNYDEYWQPQQVSQHLKKVGQVPVLIVGGWYDAEDLQGPLRIYRRIEEWNKNNRTHLVMGPWYHGSWNGGPGNALWDIPFTVNTGEEYRTQIQRPFFDYYLRDVGNVNDISEVTMFDTGAHRWFKGAEWPPKDSQPINLMLQPDGSINLVDKPARGSATPIEWLSDPARPVPSSATISVGMPREYLLEDQRFVWKRPDVVSFVTEPMNEDLTLVGPISAALSVSTSGTDSDFVVKLIDVFPYDSSVRSARDGTKSLAGYQKLVRGEPMRAKFRNSWSKPEPMVANERTAVNFVLPDICHTFKKGHRVMVQIQSSWFPIVDRNPQKFVENIFFAKPEDFQKATQRIFVGGADGSRLSIRIAR
ncbi:MAG: CocE/NonD family hydrolase [Methanoregulaceae archaeon]|nr:CocE/NonD family hydrolase [Methanoregulaceae archaeon]